jgi:hypothetical protein
MEVKHGKCAGIARNTIYVKMNKMAAVFHNVGSP